MTFPESVFNGCCTEGFEFVFQSTPLITCGDCTTGDAYPCYELTVAGVTNNNCTLCSAWNGTWQIDDLGTGCEWRFTNTDSVRDYNSGFGPCHDDDLGIFLAYGTSEFRLTFRSQNFLTNRIVATYYSDDNNCNQTSWGFTYQSDDGACQNWPSTLTLTPC